MNWKPIPNYEDVYVISSAGIVKRIKYYDAANIKKYPNGNVLSLRPDKDGYLKVALTNKGKTETCFVHRLVASTFLDNPNNLPQVNHKNGIKDDNRVENLEWVSRSENIRHRIDVLGISLRNKKGSKPVLQYTMDGTFVKEYPSAKEAGRIIQGSQGHISECCRGEKPHYRNYKWYYKSSVGND